MIGVMYQAPELKFLICLAYGMEPTIQIKQYAHATRIRDVWQHMGIGI